MDPKWLRDIQKAGWVILAADEEHVWGACPRDGCTMRAKLHPSRPIPETSCRGPDLAEKTVEFFDDARLFLRDRREGLGLTIREVEESAGITVDFLAKFEKDDPSKFPNAQTFFEWAKTLGYEVVLRPCPLPPTTLRVLSDTRAKLRMRLTKFRIHGERRSRG
jgi:transcriptional regulator with XRE-family HTH domain